MPGVHIGDEVLMAEGILRSICLSAYGMPCRVGMHLLAAIAGVRGGSEQKFPFPVGHQSQRLVLGLDCLLQTAYCPEVFHLRVRSHCAFQEATLTSQQNSRCPSSGRAKSNPSGKGVRRLQATFRPTSSQPIRYGLN